MQLSEFLKYLKGVTRKADYYLAICPSHDDRKRSLSVKAGKDGVVCYCHAGCSVEQVVDALDLKLSDLFYEPPKKTDGFAATYDYTDENGKLLFQVCRTHDKQFPQRTPDGAGGWRWGIKGVTPVLYRLPQIKEALAKDDVIFFVEGEKDANNLVRLGLTATTAPMGAGKWRDHYAEQLRGADLVLIPDNDDAGRGHVEAVGAALLGIAKRVRLLDLPNLPPKGDVSDWLSMGGTKEAFWDLVERSPEVEKPWSEDLTLEVNVGNRRFTFGRDCALHMEKRIDGEMIPTKVPFARCVWPREKYLQVEDGEFGVRYLFRDHAGEMRHGVLPHGATVDAGAASKAAGQAASKGVQVAPESKSLFAVALGHWGKTAQKHISLVRTPGWHRDQSVYVNGSRIFGGRNWKSDETAPGIEARSGRSGDIEQWKKQSRELISTPGIRAALGLSLAGPLVGMLNVVPFGVHFCGDSSHGKSTAARLAASVWGNPQTLFQTWNAGRRALEGLADPSNGAVLVLDEIKNFDGKPEHLSAAIHSLCSQQGRARMAPDGTLLQQRRWENTLLSTGEVRTRDLLGQWYQGGHRVRMADAWISSGDLTTSKEHAAKLDRLSYQCFGVLGDAWVESLIEFGVDKIRAVWEKYATPPSQKTETNEQQRVRGNLALVATALHFASEAKLIPLDEFDVWITFDWLMDVTQDDLDQDADVTPNERAWALLLQWTETQPYRFPFSSNHSTGRDVIAYKVVTGDGDELTFDLWTTEAMLRSSGLDTSAGIQIRHWLTWLEEKGRASNMGRARLAGLQRRWIRLNCDTSPPCDSHPEDESHEKTSQINLL